MKAYQLAASNEPLVLVDLPDRKPEPTEVVVKLRCAALNHRDVWIQKGVYHTMKFPVITGADGAGVVSVVGSEVDQNWLHKEVIINPGVGWGSSEFKADPAFAPLGTPRDGTFADQIVIPAAQLVHKPAFLSWEEAAALPIGGVTAYRALFSRANLQANENLLITGIGGGVAQFAILFAKAVGARVLGTSSSEEKMRQAKDLGVELLANYREKDWADQLQKAVPVGFDIVFDSAVGPDFQKIIDLCAPGGRIVFFGVTAGRLATIDMQTVYRQQLTILGTKSGSPRDFQAMVDFVEKHKIKPVIDRVMPISEINQAFSLVDQGKQFGKIVFKISQD
jgi:zinc-binding alcohol dehydrogenase/oxidoreductase